MNSHKTNVLITIDTEFSLGGYFKNPANKPVPADKIIFCKLNGKEYGINLIMDILDCYGLTGVFFLEVESRFYFGEKEILRIFEVITNRGHEVQLHIHPTYRSFIHNQKQPDDMRCYSFNQQESFIAEALDFLDKNKMPKISAYRSGGFYSNTDTLKAVQNNNLSFCSNYNLSFPNCDYIKEYPSKNDAFLINRLLELPVTCFKEPPLRKEWNSFQLSAASTLEIINALNFYHKKNVRFITYITHSFEFIKAFDYQYNVIKPLSFLIKRFESICHFLADNSHKFEVTTFSSLTNIFSHNQDPGDTYFYKSPISHTAMRYFENIVYPKLF